MNRRNAPQAPTRDGAVIAVPAWSEAAALLDANRRFLSSSALSILGKSLPAWRERTRAEVVAAAHAYLRQRGEPIPPGDGSSLVMGGHQPELFHPGVWIKNFAIHGLARSHGATALNLIVDNDTVKTTSLRLPEPGDPPHATTVPYDYYAGATPYEEHRIAQPDLFASFADRANKILHAWDYEPLLHRFWQEACRRPREQWSLAECFPAARRDLERRWGCYNLELPVSVLSQTESFAAFANHLLTELPRFHSLYNEVVHNYRRRHGLRGNQHPVPDLANEGDWLESPFWAWRPNQTRRGRLFARSSGKDPTLRFDSEPPFQLSVPRSQIKVRPRALTTTLFVRLFLADIFVHGIGGGKYDELTDELIRRFYGIEPPRFVILTGTKRLPLPALPATVDDRRRQARQLRDIYYNPERHLDASRLSSLHELTQRKKEWVARVPETSAESRERFESIREISAQLRSPLADREKMLRDELRHCDRLLAANAVFQRRDYAFCLYPEATLRPFCTQFLR